MTEAGRRIELWVEARDGAPAINPVMQSVLQALRSDGVDVRVRVPEREVADPAAATLPPALVLLKTATTFGLSCAIADEAAGIRFLNRAHDSLRTNDKAATIACLADAGLPVPPTFLAQAGDDPTQPPPGLVGPWFVKPTRGVHGTGVVEHQAFPLNIPLAATTGGATVVDDGTRLVQMSVGGDTPDIKVYVAGETIFAGRKRFAPRSFAVDAIAPITLDSATADLVNATGEALGLRLFGIDLRTDEGTAFIIDVNPFPGYRGFPEAVSPILGEIERGLAE